MFDDLIESKVPPPNRIGLCEGGLEQHLPEAAVMLAFAMHLLATRHGLMEVRIHPDGEYGKRFDISAWLQRRGFERRTSLGTTAYGGNYALPSGETVIVNPKSGLGDVVAILGPKTIVAECKGGIINTRHPGQQSRLRRGLCETVGMSLASAMTNDQEQFAVVPHTPTTEVWAKRMAPRAYAAGIRIALVDGQGRVYDVPVGTNEDALPA